MDRAGGEAARTALREQTAPARRLGIVGGPGVIVDGELFRGDDRLEDALETALAASGRCA